MTMTDAGLSPLVTYQGEQAIHFQGRKLGHGTTESPDNHRWLEIDIYQTQAGQYVVEKVGMSVVYHSPGASCGSRGSREEFTQTDAHDLVPCQRCKPKAVVGDTIVLEEEKHETFVSATPEEMVRTLLPHVALRALREAARNDDVLQEKFFVKEVE